MAQSSVHSSGTSHSELPERPSSALSKKPILPPISISPTVSPSTCDSDPQELIQPPSPTGAAPDHVNDSNIELLVRKKHLLIKYVMGVPDLMPNAEKYEPNCRMLAHGTLKRMNPLLSNRLRLIDLFIDGSYFELVTQYWHKLDLREPSQWKETVNNPQVTAKYSVFTYMLMPLWNGTDVDDIDRLKKFDEAMRPFYLTMLGNPALHNFVGIDAQSKLVRCILGTLHNLVRHCPETIGPMRDSGSVNVVSRYISHSDLSTKTKAILVLSYIVSENEHHKLVVTGTFIKHIINVLADCMEGTMPRHYSRAYGYQADDVLDGLNQLAASDANKEAIVEHGALPFYARLLKDDCEPREQAAACRGLWLLAFNALNRSLLKAECLPALQKLCSSPAESVRRAAEGAVWEIEGKVSRGIIHQRSGSTASAVGPEAATAGATTAAAAAVPMRRGKHIMLSYNWGVKSEVVRIKEMLQAAGYQVWIDVEQMSGSTLDAMASAIEESSVVLIFFTEQYKMSASCRSEAEYCYKLKIPFIPIRMQPKYVADGWLGIILGSKLFVDFTKDSEWNSSFAKLRKEIDQITKQVALSPVASGQVDISKGSNKPSYSDVGVQTTITADRHIYAAEDLLASSWTEDDVRQWLCKHRLGNACDRFGGFSGIHVTELHNALVTAPLYFYGLLESKFGLSVEDGMLFTKIVRELR